MVSFVFSLIDDLFFQFKYMKHLRKFLLVSILFTTFFNHAYTHNTDSILFQSPLNIPLFLSGNYGELRTNHFHAGLDLKTGSEIGKPVFSPASGYVSRIKIQSNGYGKSIYITHPNGYTTVYGHLNAYIPDIEGYVKSNQYKKHTYEIDLYPPSSMFKVSKGDIIAYSGNTGSSGGPHLHFEIRKTREEIPVNGLLYSLPIEDNRSPEFKILHVYSLPLPYSVGNNGEIRTSYHISRINNSTYQIGQVIKCSTRFIGFSTEIYDFLNNSSNRCGIYKMELLVDEQPVFNFIIDNIPFDLTKGINAHMDYDLKVNENTGVHRLFKLPNDPLPIYKESITDGIIHLADDTLHTAEILAFDAYGNKSVLRFKFKHDEKSIPDNPTIDSLLYIKYNQEKSFALPGIEIKIPANSFYRDVNFSLSSSKKSLNSLSDTFNIHFSSEPLKSPIVFKYKTDSISMALVQKLIFARVNGGNKLVSEGGDWSHGILTAKVRNLGKYIIVADTLAPAIRSVNFTSGERFYPGQQIVFRVDDELSGIKTYNLYINDKWALLEYDEKTDRMFYTIDKDRLVQGQTYRVKLYVMDEKNNIALFQGKFQY